MFLQLSVFMFSESPFEILHVSFFNKWHATQKHIKSECFISAAVVVFHTGRVLFCIRWDDCVRAGDNEWCLMRWTVMPPTAILGPQAITFTFPPVCGQSAANLPWPHASSLQHWPNMCVRVLLPSQPRRILHRLKPLNKSSYSHD